MPAMSKPDHSDIDGRLLQVLLAVFEEQSVTRAAQRLDVTQSAVSHQLDKLRAIVGDALFVKSGRGIVATARAEALAAARTAAARRDARLRQRRRLRPGHLRGRGHHRRQRPAARPAAAAAVAPCARACAGAVAAHHSLRRARRRDAARRTLPAADHAAPARGQRHRAGAPVRGPLSRLPRRHGARRAARPGRLSVRRAPDGALRAAPHARHRPVDRRTRAPPPLRRHRAGVCRHRRLPARQRTSWPRCPGCCAPTCCAALRWPSRPSPARRCRCTPSGTCATRPTHAPVVARRAAAHRGTGAGGGRVARGPTTTRDRRA